MQAAHNINMLRILTGIFCIAFAISTSSISNGPDMNWPLHIAAANITFISLYIRLLIIAYLVSKSKSNYGNKTKSILTYLIPCLIATAIL